MDWFQQLVTALCVIISSTCIYEVLSEENGPLVEIDSGKIRGFHMTSRSGRTYNAFTKIPYAKPPVGPLRFKPGDPDIKWGQDEVLDATGDLPDCWQNPLYDPSTRNKTFGTEDCLYLSVFSPKLGSESNDLPVMIFIHGGGWRSELPRRGTQSSRSKFLMDEDIILVTFHYRLGAFGFLSTEDEVLPGNLGLKDQNLVIKWVKRNIAKFGGDPNKITMFGNSAGGASTHYHLISPLSKDLIQGGISESGAATCIWALTVPGSALRKAKALAKILNCPEEPSEELVSCLKTKPASDISSAEQNFIKRDFDPLIWHQPIVESGPDAFLPDSPYNLKIEKPWIAGVNTEDGAFKTIYYKLYPELMESFLKDGVSLLPDGLMFSDSAEDPKQVAESILEQYTINDLSQNFTDLWTDGYFTHAADQGLIRSGENGYLYIFGYRGKTSSNDVLASGVGKVIDDIGVSHTDELFYLFNFQDSKETEHTEADQEVSKRVVKIWTDFAKHGRPTLVKDWKPYNDGGSYLKIAKLDSVETNLWPSRINFWRNVPVRNKMEQMKL